MSAAGSSHFAPATLGRVPRSQTTAESAAGVARTRTCGVSAPSASPTFRSPTYMSAREPTSPEELAGPAAPIEAIVELTGEEVHSFKELGAEVKLITRDGDEIWLVPTNTDIAHRVELSVDALRVISRVCEIFRVTNVRCEETPSGGGT
jgi:hypothetical protein